MAKKALLLKSKYIVKICWGGKKNKPTYRKDETLTSDSPCPHPQQIIHRSFISVFHTNNRNTINGWIHCVSSWKCHCVHNRTLALPSNSRKSPSPTSSIHIFFSVVIQADARWTHRVCYYKPLIRFPVLCHWKEGIFFLSWGLGVKGDGWLGYVCRLLGKGLIANED